MGQMFGGDALPIIGNFHTGPLPLRPQPQVMPTVRVAQPIPQQILQDLNKAVAIPKQYHRLLRGWGVQGVDISTSGNGDSAWESLSTALAAYDRTTWNPSLFATSRRVGMAPGSPIISSAWIMAQRTIQKGSAGSASNNPGRASGSAHGPQFFGSNLYDPPKVYQGTDQPAICIIWCQVGPLMLAAMRYMCPSGLLLLDIGQYLLETSYFPFTTVFFPARNERVSTIDYYEGGVIHLLGGKK